MEYSSTEANGCVIAPAQAQTHTSCPLFHTWILPDGSPWALLHRTGSSYLIRFPDLADFEVSADGGQVHCRPVPGIDRGTIEHLYLNQVLPAARSRRGKLVVHASAVAFERCALAFSGHSGRGKSTLAAAFALRGIPFLTDDGLSLHRHGQEYFAEPSHKSIRLWGDSREHLLAQDRSLGTRVSYSSKARIAGGDALAFTGRAQPLRRFYFLGPGETSNIRFRTLSAGDAVVELLKQSFLLDIEDRSELTNHFEQAAALARLPIFYRLDYPRRFDRLGDVCQAILAHCRPVTRGALPDRTQ